MKIYMTTADLFKIVMDDYRPGEHTVPALLVLDPAAEAPAGAEGDDFPLCELVLCDEKGLSFSEDVAVQHINFRLTRER